MATVVPKYEVTGLTIELDMKEAAVLYFILGKVGGDPSKSVRKYIISLTNKLEKVGKLQNDAQEKYIKGKLDCIKFTNGVEF